MIYFGGLLCYNLRTNIPDMYFIANRESSIYLSSTYITLNYLPGNGVFSSFIGGNI